MKCKWKEMNLKENWSENENEMKCEWNKNEYVYDMKLNWIEIEMN